MPVTIKKTKTCKAELPPGRLFESEPLVSGLSVSNRAARTPIGWITDASPSMTGFTEAQLQSAKSMVAELRQLPSTSRSVMMNIVQIGSPPMATGFGEIAEFQVPGLHVVQSTPLHSALERMTNDLGELCSDLRSQGIERSESVVIFTTDGFANDAGPEQLEDSIRKFLDLGKKWSVTNIVVGVGSQLNEPILKRLANSIPPLQIQELNAALLMPFIQKIAVQVSQSRRGQNIELYLPDGIKPIE